MQDNSSVQLCKDRSGRWRQSDTDDSDHDVDQASGSSSRAEITYNGDWIASASIAPRVNFDGLNLNSMVRQALNTRHKDISGPVTLVVTFSGQQISSVLSGRYFGNQVMVGTVKDGYCRLAQSAGPDSIEGYCGRDGFSGTIKGKSKDGWTFSGKLESSSVKFVDLDEREKQQIAAEKARQAEIAAAEAKIRNAPAAGPVLTKKLAALVSTDSRGWFTNHYDSGSVTNVKIIDGSVRSGRYTLRGDYTYNGGMSGWVIAKMSGPNLDCIQFHDSVIGCRGLRTPEQAQRTRDTANALLSSTGGSSNSNQECNASCQGDRQSEWMINQENDRRYQEDVHGPQPDN